MEREKLNTFQIANAIDLTVAKLNFRLQQKGYGTFTSSHEILGVITEEYYELIEAVKSNTLNEVKEELKDIAVGCIFAIACIEDGTIDW